MKLNLLLKSSTNDSLDLSIREEKEDVAFILEVENSKFIHLLIMHEHKYL